MVGLEAKKLETAFFPVLWLWLPPSKIVMIMMMTLLTCQLKSSRGESPLLTGDKIQNLNMYQHKIESETANNNIRVIL